MDESGGPDAPDNYFVLGAIAISESDADALRLAVKLTIEKHLHAHLRGLEIHAKVIRTGEGPWRSIPAAVRLGLLDDLSALLHSFAQSHPSFRLFAVAKSPHSLPDVDPVERCFEELLGRFQSMLMREQAALGTRLGIVVADEAKYERTLQPVVTMWRDTGMRFARLSRIMEVPLFVDSKATRLLQMADLVSHATYRAYETRDDRFFNPMRPAFDSVNGVVHGFVHLRRRWRECKCFACASRKDATLIVP